MLARAPRRMGCCSPRWERVPPKPHSNRVTSTYRTPCRHVDRRGAAKGARRHPTLGGAAAARRTAPDGDPWRGSPAERRRSGSARSTPGSAAAAAAGRPGAAAAGSTSDRGPGRGMGGLHRESAIQPALGPSHESSWRCVQDQVGGAGTTCSTDDFDYAHIYTSTHTLAKAGQMPTIAPHLPGRSGQPQKAETMPLTPC